MRRSITQSYKPSWSVIEKQRSKSSRGFLPLGIWIDFAVATLAESIILEQCNHGQQAVALHAHASVVRFLSAQRARMPDYLRLPLDCLTLLFEVWSLPFTGRTFHRLPHQLRAVRGSSPCRLAPIK